MCVLVCVEMGPYNVESLFRFAYCSIEQCKLLNTVENDTIDLLGDPFLWQIYSHGKAHSLQCIYSCCFAWCWVKSNWIQFKRAKMNLIWFLLRSESALNVCKHVENDVILISSLSMTLCNYVRTSQWRIIIVVLRQSPQSTRYLGFPKSSDQLIFSHIKRVLRASNQFEEFFSHSVFKLQIRLWYELSLFWSSPLV